MAASTGRFQKGIKIKCRCSYGATTSECACIVTHDVFGSGKNNQSAGFVIKINQIMGYMYPLSGVELFGMMNHRDK